MSYRDILMKNKNDCEVYYSDDEEKTEAAIEIENLKSKAKKEGINDYILVVLKCANFQPRTALIPYNEFKSVRPEEYDFMKKCGTIIISPIIWEGNIGTEVESKITKIKEIFMMYIDPPVDGCYLDVKDFIWSENTIYNLKCSNSKYTFDEYKTYEDLKKLTNINGKNINIVESYLFLDFEIEK